MIYHGVDLGYRCSWKNYPLASETIRATAWQNQQNGLWSQGRLRSAWGSTRSDQSSLFAWRSVGSLATPRAHSEVGRMSRLIWVSTGRTCHFVGFVMRRLILICGTAQTMWLVLENIARATVCENVSSEIFDQERFKPACSATEAS